MTVQNNRPADDLVFCLACAGAVAQADALIPEGVDPCSCPPTATEQEAAMVDCPNCGGSLRVGVRACPFCSSTLATQRCGHCAAWNLSSAAHCQRCGGGLTDAARSDATRAAGAPCPRCAGALSARMYAELDVDECDKCGGLFVESSMLNRIVEARDRGGNLHLHCALPRRDRWHEQMVRYLPCPACTKPMNRKVFAKVSGIIIDACREHGVWFDAGELTDALEFVSKGGLEEARKKELLALDDARRAHRSAENAASAVTMGVARPAGRPLERFAGGIIAGVLVDAWLG